MQLELDLFGVQEVLEPAAAVVVVKHEAQTPKKKKRKSRRKSGEAAECATTGCCDNPWGKSIFCIGCLDDHSEEGKKWCNPCGSFHLLEGFYGNGECTAAKAAHRASPERKAAQAAYNASPERKAARAAYNASPEGQAVRAAYDASPEGQAVRAAYEASPEGKAVRAAYEASPDGKASRKARKGRRRTKEANVPGDHLLEGAAYAAALHAGCFQCSEELDDNLPYMLDGVVNPRYVTLEHMRPLSKGGTGLVDNLALSHHVCNVSAGDRMPNGGVGANGMVVPEAYGL